MKSALTTNCHVVQKNTRVEAILDMIVTNTKTYLKTEILLPVSSSNHIHGWG